MSNGITLNDVYSRLSRMNGNGTAQELSPAVKQQVEAEFRRAAPDGLLPQQSADGFIRGVSKKLSSNQATPPGMTGLLQPQAKGVRASGGASVGVQARGGSTRGPAMLPEVVVRPTEVVRAPNGENVVRGPFKFTEATSWATGHKTGFYSMGLQTLSDRHWQAGWNAAYTEIAKLNPVADIAITAYEIYEGKAAGGVGLAKTMVEKSAEQAARETVNHAEKEALEKIGHYAKGIGTAISACLAIGEVRENNERGPGAVEAAAYEMTARIMAAEYGSGQLAVGGTSSYCNVKAPPHGQYSAGEVDAIANHIFGEVCVTLSVMRDSPRYGAEVREMLRDSQAFATFQKQFVDSMGDSYRIGADRFIAENKAKYHGTIVEHIAPEKGGGHHE